MVSRDPRFDVLFEPVALGPLSARNRFYQVPHCNGMGYRDPSAMAAMRGVKAEGGWAVVCTEETEIHPGAEVTPHIELRNWDDADLPILSRMAEAVHAHGALAGIELCHNGMSAANFASREVPLGPSHLPVRSAYAPVQARAMDKHDIADLRRRHTRAALRARAAGFDVIYVYAGHMLATPEFFLSPAFNTRTDEYGGSLENRARLLRELIEDTKDAVGERCAVAVRLALAEIDVPGGLERNEIRDVVGLLAELPDLWDFALADWSQDSRTSRFAEEGAQAPYLAGLGALTSKPVVGVGRFTSPDAMAAEVRSGALDFIGAARPSIADPFLPRKIELGQLDDIRECIGCNICVSGDLTGSPIRCTQNPTMGEEWRKGWHPERIPQQGSDASVLVVGAGPAGLECARALGQRGYRVTLAEAGAGLGGRVTLESALPGLAVWARVRDYRVQQIQTMPNVEVFRESPLDAEQVLELGFAHVVVATGAAWRRDGVGRAVLGPVRLAADLTVLTPDELMTGARPEGEQVLIYDDDHFYLGGVLAELLAAAGKTVTLATPAPDVSQWTQNTLEQGHIRARLLGLGVEILSHRRLLEAGTSAAALGCTHSDRVDRVATDALILVTARLPRDDLYKALELREADWAAAGIRTVRLIGDAAAPATIAHAVYAGHRYARELDAPEIGDAVPFRREITALSDARSSGR